MGPDHHAGGSLARLAAGEARPLPMEVGLKVEGGGCYVRVKDNLGPTGPAPNVSGQELAIGWGRRPLAQPAA